MLLQKEQTQIRQLLQELPDQGLLCLLIDISEDSISRIVTTWIITLEKQGCPKMIQAGE